MIVVKNLHKSFSFEVQILDDQNQLRRFRSSNYQSKTRVTNFATSMPVISFCSSVAMIVLNSFFQLALNPGWNQIQMNLADFTQRAYSTNYLETVRITVNANCRLRNVYFSDRLYSDDEKPASFKFQATQQKDVKIEKTIASGVHDKVIEVETVRPTSPVTIDP